MRFIIRTIVGLGAGLALVGCNNFLGLGDDNGGDPEGEKVVVFGTQSPTDEQHGDALVVYSGSSDVEERIQLPRTVEHSAFSPDSSVLYFTAFGDQLSDRSLLAWDMNSLEIIKTRRIEEIVGTDDPNKVSAVADRGVTVSPDGSELFLAEWVSGRAEMGVRIVDAQTFEPTGFMGSLRVHSGGLATLPPGVRWPNGAVLAYGDRGEGSEVSLFVIDPERREVVDSLPVSVDDPLALLQLVPAGDGRHVYLNGLISIARYDIEARAVQERVYVPTVGQLTLSRDGKELYRSDQMIPNGSFPGGGRIFVFGPDLQEREHIDLSGHRINGHPPMIVGTAPSRDGEHLYAVAGTGAITNRGLISQEGRFYVIRLADHHVERVIDLNVWGPGPPIVP